MTSDLAKLYRLGIWGCKSKEQLYGMVKERGKKLECLT